MQEQECSELTVARVQRRQVLDTAKQLRRRSNSKGYSSWSASPANSSCLGPTIHPFQRLGTDDDVLSNVILAMRAERRNYIYLVASPEDCSRSRLRPTRAGRNRFLEARYESNQAGESPSEDDLDLKLPELGLRLSTLEEDRRSNVCYRASGELSRRLNLAPMSGLFSVQS